MLRVRLRRAERDGAPAPRALPVRQGAVPPPFAQAASAARFTGGAGQVLDLPGPEGRVLLIGAGAPHRATEWEAAGGRAAAAALACGARRLALDARGLPPAAAAALAAGACLRAWRLDRWRTRTEEVPLAALDLLVDDPAATAPLWARAEAAVRGCLLARDLTAEPGNRLTTREFAARLEALSEHGIAVDVLGRRRLARAGFGALLAVGRAAAHPPRLAVLRWRGSFAAPPLAFIGKGITFDTGGLSLKPAEGMEAMRGDMAGAAACAGAMLALALRRSPAPAVAVLALAENAIGADAYRPGDVLTTLSGRTVEVVDTDAEGRLVLADALHYARTRFAPAAMLDLATLTGAAVTALGHHRAALFGTDAALLAQVAAAGEAVGEPVWPLPIGARHREDLASDIADLRQCATGRFLPDACHAAAFLREFAGGVPWAHLDIAGVARRAEEEALGPKGPSGFGARLLDALVAMYFEDPDRH
jgi:leucyl aminopeptidase